MSVDPVVDVQVRQLGDSAELYITARPGKAADAQSQADALTKAVADVLREHHAVALQERVFAEPGAMSAVSRARGNSLGNSGGIEPTWLVTPVNATGPISGILVHAAKAAPGKVEVLSLDGKPCGRVVEAGASAMVVGCGLQGDCSLPAGEQAKEMLAKAERLLSAAGANLASVSRTWMWLGDILKWYGEFNRVRNELFAARGLLRKDASGRMPASTGIGIGPSGGGCCVMDFCAVLGQERPNFLLAGGNQGAASKYGSAFSRASWAPTPGGKTVYVSGTAAIDAEGVTTHIGDARGQIEDTLTNVLAVLKDAGCGWQDVVQAIVYCKTPEVERIFRQGFGNLPIPHIVAVADVCRDNLLFEVEATAMPRA